MATAQDREDFIAMLQDDAPELAAWAVRLEKKGLDPRDIATRIEYSATRVRGWCTGRFYTPALQSNKEG